MAKKMAGDCDSDYVWLSSSSSSMGKKSLLRLRRLSSSTLRLWWLVIAGIIIFIISVSWVENAEAKENSTKTEVNRTKTQANESIAVPRNRPRANSLRQGGFDDSNLGTDRKQMTKNRTTETDLDKLLIEALNEGLVTEKGCLITLRERCEELRVLPEKIALLTPGSEHTIVKDLIYEQLNVLPELKEKFVFGDVNDREIVLEKIKENLTESQVDKILLGYLNNAQELADNKPSANPE